MICRPRQCCGEARRNIQVQETATWTCLWIPHHEMPPSYHNRSQKVAMTLFENLDVELVDGHCVLGSVMGSSSACEKF